MLFLLETTGRRVRPALNLIRATATTQHTRDVTAQRGSDAVAMRPGLTAALRDTEAVPSARLTVTPE